MYEIAVVCVGWSEDQMSLRDAGILENQASIALRTERCGCAEYLSRKGIPYCALDGLYESSEDFDRLDEEIVAYILREAEKGPVCYVTPSGSDRAAAKLLRAYPEAKGELRLYAQNPVNVVSASDWETFRPDARKDTFVSEISDPLLASEMKLKLMETYADETPIFFATPQGDIRRDVLENLDRMGEYDHRCAAVICREMEYARRNALDLQDLEDILAVLREKCPWDREQTHESLKKYLLEEAYEAADAIDQAEESDLCEELGDVLFQVAFHAQIAKEHGEYQMLDVIDGICRKMLRRHRHVFGGAKAENSEAVAALWQQVKKEEKKLKRPEDAVIGVSAALPALTLAQKALARARENGVAMPEFTDDLGGRLLREAAQAREDAEGALRGAVLEWMRRIRTESDQNQ